MYESSKIEHMLNMNRSMCPALKLVHILVSRSVFTVIQSSSNAFELYTSWTISVIISPPVVGFRDDVFLQSSVFHEITEKNKETEDVVDMV